MAMNNQTEFDDLRTELGLSQSAVARLLGVTPRSVNRWVRGAVETPEYALVALRGMVQLRQLTEKIDRVLEGYR